MPKTAGTLAATRRGQKKRGSTPPVAIRSKPTTINMVCNSNPLFFRGCEAFLSGEAPRLWRIIARLFIRKVFL
jgi:hypothetical protein